MADPTTSLDGEILRIAGAAAVTITASVVTYFLGRHSKNREFLTSDLNDRAKEFRELLASIEKNAVTYWSQDRNDATQQLSEVLRVDLHRLQSLRVYCADVCDGFKSENMRTLESQLFDAITGGSFEGANRNADPARVTRTRHVASALSMASLRARRADLFTRRPKF
jgi:hypothetical protein